MLGRGLLLGEQLEHVGERLEQAAGPTRFGPMRDWKRPSSLRSTSRMIGTISSTNAKITIDFTISTSVLSSPIDHQAGHRLAAPLISTGPVGAAAGGDEEDAAGRHAGAHARRRR